MIPADLEPILIEHQQQMVAAALQNKDFRVYLQTAAAEKLTTEFSNQTVNFVTTGKKHFVTDDNKANVIATMQATFKRLHERVVAEESVRLAKLTPVPSEASPPPPTTTAKAVPDSPSIALSTANFQKAFEAAQQLKRKSMTTFQPKTITMEAATLRIKIEKAPDDNARWKLAEEFTKKNPNDLLTKPLMDVMSKLKNEVGYRKVL